MKTILTLVAVAAVLAVSAAHPQQTKAPEQFALFFYEPTKTFAHRQGPESKAYWDAWYAYIGELQASGKMTGGSGLTAPEDGRLIDQTGSRAAGTVKLALGGFVTVRADSLEAALELAKKSPAITGGGRVEARPLLPMAPKQESSK